MLGSRPIRPLTREEVRALDRVAAEEFGLPTLVLMENASRGASEVLLEELGRRNGRGSGSGGVPRIVILAGSGNNGGDGGALARHLDRVGLDVHVVWLARPGTIRGDAAVQHRVLDRAGIAQEVRDPEAEPDLDWLGPLLARADWVVDGLFGTGLSRPIAGRHAEVVDRLNTSERPVLALDIPSGLDADTGQPQGIAVRARLTVTFVARKAGFERQPAPDYLGDVHVVDIGVPRIMLEPYMK